MIISVPDDVARAAGIRQGDDLLVEPAPGGLLVRSDSLRKVYVEITGRCNLTCTMCPRAAWDATTDDMSPACFEAVLRGLPSTGPGEVTLALGGFGEPTLHPHFLPMIAAARSAGHRIEVITNGTTLVPGLADDLLALGVAQVTVSLDGLDDGSYAAMRGRPAGAALAGLAALCDARRRAATRTSVGLAIVLTRRNAASLPALIDLADRLGVDAVTISNVVPHTAAMADDALWTRAGCYAMTAPATLRPRITTGRFDREDITRPLVERLLAQTPCLPPPVWDDGRWLGSCRFARDGMLAVSWDGRVAPCLSLLYTHPEFIGGREKTVCAFQVGDVRQSGLADIWRAAHYRAFRRRVREFDVSPCLECGGCPIVDTNETDCFGTPFPSCSECLWAQGMVLCP